MAAKKIGTVIREARTEAGLTQEQLARKVTGVSVADLRKVEAGEADFTQAQLKALAKPLGVTQKSLLEAPKNLGASKKTTSTSASKKTTSTNASKKTTSTSASKKTTSTSASKKTTASAATPKTPANANSTMKVTAAERKLIESYRTASADAKKAAARILKGESAELLDQINGKNDGGLGGLAQNFLGDLVGNLMGGK